MARHLGGFDQSVTFRFTGTNVSPAVPIDGHACRGSAGWANVCRSTGTNVDFACGLREEPKGITLFPLLEPKLRSCTFLQHCLPPKSRRAETQPSALPWALVWGLRMANAQHEWVAGRPSLAAPFPSLSTSSLEAKSVSCPGSAWTSHRHCLLSTHLAHHLPEDTSLHWTLRWYLLCSETFHGSLAPSQVVLKVWSGGPQIPFQGICKVQTNSNLIWLHYFPIYSHSLTSKEQNFLDIPWHVILKPIEGRADVRIQLSSVKPVFLEILKDVKQSHSSY